MKTSHRVAVSVCSALVWGAAQAACPSWPTAERFVINDNAGEVTDQRTGLVWKRCMEGTTGAACSETVSGVATVYTHEAALKRAQALNPTASASGWRLPTVKELSSLADKGCISPAIDSTAFPATTSFGVWFWSASPFVRESRFAWSVHFGNGNVSEISDRDDKQPVRLVRASQ